MELGWIGPIESLWWSGGGVLEGIRERERVLEAIRGYSDYRVLAQLGFGLATAWLALAWLELGFDNFKFASANGRSLLCTRACLFIIIFTPILES